MRDIGTKAETLARLESADFCAHTLPQERTDWQAWSADKTDILSRLSHRGWLNLPVIVRSSAQVEDGIRMSLAGHYLSVSNVRGKALVEDAIGRVFSSFGPGIRGDDQIFVQPFLNDVIASGVAFSRDPSSGAPYIVINYSQSADTTAVTGGTAGGLETFYFWKHHDRLPKDFLGDVVKLLRDLESVLQGDALDVEFAVSRTQGLCLLQVRSLNIENESKVDPSHHRTLLERIARRVEVGSMPHPYLHGRRTIYGVMPDWNPAEIIGTRPRPLALSLYRHLITDQIWAYQRSNYGYKNLRSFPLLVSFCGQPYVDVRVSFNSFLPADIESPLADQLVDYYLAQLEESPALHDKIEFEIVYSCYTFDLPERIADLKNYGFTESDITALTKSLRRLTNRIIHSDGGLWRADLRRIRELEPRRRRIMESKLDHPSKIYWVLEDCKRWGTLPFAGLARVAFIAMQLLRSMVATGVISESQRDLFLSHLNTVTSQMMRDLDSMDRQQFLKHYGHLRPGTYDILSPRYDENPGRYLDGGNATSATRIQEEILQLGASQAKRLSALLEDNGLELEAEEVFEFIKLAIQGRERAKFLFTRSLSDALVLLSDLGRTCGLTVDDMSYADISALEELYASSGDPGEILKRSVDAGRRQYRDTCLVRLPPLVSGPADVWSFHQPPNEPNYITQGIAEGRVQTCGAESEDLRGAIVFIFNADPGFDWIFSKGIAGLITAFGGVNSHMAIRASECEVPAVIGVGESLFELWSHAKTVRIDCANRRVEVLR